MLKRLTLSLLLSALPLLAIAAPDSYRLDPVHTRVLFAVEHAGFSHALGTVSGSEGVLVFDPDDWRTARLEVSVPIDRPGMLAQGGQGMLAAQEGALQAGEAALPLGQRHLRQGRAMGTGDAGIVDQAIHAPEALQRRLHQCLHAAFAGHVRALERRALRQRPLLQAGLAGIGIQVGDRSARSGRTPAPLPRPRASWIATPAVAL